MKKKKKNDDNYRELAIQIVTTVNNAENTVLDQIDAVNELLKKSITEQSISSK